VTAEGDIEVMFMNANVTGACQTTRPLEGRLEQNEARGLVLQTYNGYRPAQQKKKLSSEASAEGSTAAEWKVTTRMRGANHNYSIKVRGEPSVPEFCRCNKSV